MKGRIDVIRWRDVVSIGKRGAANDTDWGWMK